MSRINVTKTSLPPFEEYTEYLKSIWESGWITNHGHIVQELEKRLKRYLKVEHLYLVANGTLALQLAFKALNLRDKEVITTSFSYVATLNALLWEGAIPIMADINPSNFQIDPDEIVKKITSNTRAIVPVHVYGFPSPIKEIEEIAMKYDLKVIYDAAHAFGTVMNGKHLAAFGDMVCYSFHATKPFHTVEGGAIIVRDPELAEGIDSMRRFGHTGDRYHGIGINAKMSELHAAMGVLNLREFEQQLERRKLVWMRYGSAFGITTPETVNHNFSYFPYLCKNEESMTRIEANLNKISVFPRRYFYPSLSKLPFFNADCPISEDIASRVICLPLFASISTDLVDRIIEIIDESS